MEPSPSASPPPERRGDGRLARLRAAPATAALMAVLAVVFAVTLAWPRLPYLFAKQDSAVLRGEFWRLFTAGFLHGGLLHLAVNELALSAIGPTVERLYGRAWLWIFFLVGGAIGFAASTVFVRAPSLGASAGIFALLGVLLAFPLRARHRIPPRARSAMTQEILMVAAANITLGFMWPTMIDNAAHLGGFGGGLLLGLAVPPAQRDGGGAGSTKGSSASR